MSDQDTLLTTPDDSGMAAVLLQLAGLADRMSALEELVAGKPDRAGYTPIPAPRWWLLDREDRERALARLGAWVDDVYRPSYGHLAATLPACWAQHPLCLYVLDWLCELHSVLYLGAKRTPSTLSGQAEWTIRQLPAAADLMAAEARGCEHSRLRMSGAIR